jgi:hypothetical protein
MVGLLLTPPVLTGGAETASVLANSCVFVMKEDIRTLVRRGGARGPPGIVGAFSSWTGRGFGGWVCVELPLLVALPLEDPSPSFIVGRVGVPCELGVKAPIPRSFCRIEVLRVMAAKKPPLPLPALELETTFFIVG